MLIIYKTHCSCPYIPWPVWNTCGFVWCHVVEYSLTVYDIHWEFEVFIELWMWTQVMKKVMKVHHQLAMIWTSKTLEWQMCMRTWGYIPNGWYSSTLGSWSVFVHLVCNVAASWNSSLRYRALCTNVPQELYPHKPPTRCHTVFSLPVVWWCCGVAFVIMELPHFTLNKLLCEALKNVHGHLTTSAYETNAWRLVSASSIG